MSVLLAGCGGNETVKGYDAKPEAEFDPGLTLVFPDRQPNGTLPLKSGGTFKVRLDAFIPHLCEPITATVELVTAAAPEDAKVSALATLSPQSPCEQVAGEVELAWPEGGEVLVRATLAGAIREERVAFGTRGVLELRVDPAQAVLPAAGEVVEVTVLATLDGVSAPGIPIRVEAVPATQVLPATGVSDARGAFRASILVPVDTLGMRIDAIAGSVRTGVTLRVAP
ncbi:hypothetical protein D7Y27_13655 [Corallococcus sp. AB004]|nr:hypothetical protein D7X99_12740 [Corallococcus sp. AB032C]RKH97072.1 hypothetical protein D7Y04_28090 [Corallococcus sp. AB038B]RKI44491.1 hypothetical protein D7Y27_13655 [Corallococcus sp. AB004]